MRRRWTRGSSPRVTAVVGAGAESNGEETELIYTIAAPASAEMMSSPFGTPRPVQAFQGVPAS
jgi:hypothetical protein